ncbi:MAG: SRPBCC domain-containing protein [Acidobacteriia bacterium]|nr:SRPBCC domain-containing protein [Terriglobia bacterium]
MATSKVTPDADAIVSEIHIAAPPERVFEGLVDLRQVVQWWGEIGVYRCTEFQCDLRVGGKWRSAGLDGQGHIFEIAGECLEVDPPRLLVLSWVATWTGSAKTMVRWELEATSQGTLVRICHSGFAAHPELAASYQGWPRMLGWLQALLERGETVDDRKPVSAS